VRKGKTMGKIFAVAMVCLMIVALLAAALPLGVTKVEASPATTIYVPDDYTTIQAAVDAASPGDTPYCINGDNDNYPLVEPFENYSIGGGGSGTEEDPYKIYDVYDLQAMNDDLTAYYELANDIDATETKDWNDGEGFLPIGQTGPFQGHFDGKGHKIKNLYVNAEGKFPEGDIRNNHGLFTELGSSAVVKNVGLEDIFIHHGWETGFAHYHMKSGAIAGLSSGSISCCWATGEIQEWGTSTPPGSAHNCAGGLVGENSGNICNSFAQGIVRAAGGGNQGGGITGVNKVDGHICCCYAACSVDAYPSEGGISGINEGTVEKSYWNIDLTPKSAGGIGKITLQMKLKVTYVDWDFENIWDIVGNETYPLLRVFEVSPGVTPPTFSGSGTELSPYLIYNVVDLQNVVGDLEAWYELPNDIDAEETENWNDGQGFIPIGQTGAFQGHLDGRGHKIKKLYINLDAHERRFPEGDIRNNQGLFNELGENAEVKNLGLEDVYINREAGTGFAIRTERAGAIAGISKGSISCCWATGEIRVHGTSTPPGSAYNYAGGLVSENHGGIFNSFTQGTVSVYGGSDRAGGIVGTNGADGHICCCYATCKVDVYPYDVGGISYCNEGLIEKSYWNIDLTPKSEGGEGKTTGQMKSKATYVDWDFDTIWDIEEGVTCPFLRVFQVGPDTTPPTVVSTSPGDGATDVAIDTVVTATFNEAMDSSTITTESFTLAGSEVSGTVTYDSDNYTATFTPDGNLDYDHEYTATLTTAIADQAGNPLAEPYTWSFTTESAPAAKPVITSPLKITPEKDTYYVDDTLTAKFTIKNEGDASITFDILTVGGRLNGGCPTAGCPDFTHQSVTLQPDESYEYQGSLALTESGNHHFFCAYHTKEHMPGEDENNWNTNIDVEVDGQIIEDDNEARRYREKDITVLEETYIEPVLGPASWERISGPWEEETDPYGDFSAALTKPIAVDPSNPQIVYVGSDKGGGLYKSIDGGNSWNSINDGLPHLNWPLSSKYWSISAIAIAPSNPDIVYVGTTDVNPYHSWVPHGMGIYKSVNGVASWTPANGIDGEQFPKHPISSMVVDPTNVDTVYVGTIAGGIWQTTDGGENWIQIWSPIGELCFEVNDLAISSANPNIIFAAVYNYVPYSGTIPSGIVFRGGLHSLERIEDGSYDSEKIFENRVDDIVVDNMNPGMVYIATCGYEVYKSTDGGGEWVDANGIGGEDPLPHIYTDNSFMKPRYSLALDPDHPNAIYAASAWGYHACGIYLSPNSGNNWFPIGLQDEHVEETVLAADSDHRILYAVTIDGLFKLDFSNSVIIVQEYSPIEIRVYDSQGRVTGLVNGEAKSEIPKSVYCNGTITIFSSVKAYHYELIGTGEGTYGLEITSVVNGEPTTFTATDIPTLSGSTHQYTIDWDALSQGEEGVMVQVDSDGDGTFEKTITADHELTHDEFMLQTATTIDFDPDTLNLASKGKFVTVYIELPLGYDVGEIDVFNIMLNSTVPAFAKPTEVGDYDSDGISDLMVKFDRTAVQEILTPGDQVEITISGEVAGITFEGSDIIRVINK